MSAELWILIAIVVAVALTYLGFLILRMNEHAYRVQTYQNMSPALFSQRVRPAIRRGFLLTMSGGFVTAVSLVLLAGALVVGLASTEEALVIGLLAIVIGTIVAALGEYAQHRAWVNSKKLLQEAIHP